MDEDYASILASPSELGAQARDSVNPELASDPGETPADTQQRVVRTQIVKARNLAAAGLPSWEQPNGLVQPVTDATGAPLTHYDKTHSIAYDSSGAPNKISYDQSGSPVLSDPLADAPTVSARNPETGLYDRYKTPSGLGWSYVEPDAARNAGIEAARARAATNAAAIALGRQLSSDEGEIVRGTSLIKAAKKRLLADVPIDPTLLGDDPKSVAGDPDAVHAAIDQHFDEQYAAPENNEKAHWFGDELSPTAQAARSQLDKAKAVAHARADQLFTTQANVTAKSNLREQQMQVEQQLRTAQLRDAAQRAGLLIPGLEDQESSARSGQPSPQSPDSQPPAPTPPDTQGLPSTGASQVSSIPPQPSQGTTAPQPFERPTGLQPDGSAPSTALRIPGTSAQGKNANTTAGTSSSPTSTPSVDPSLAIPGIDIPALAPLSSPPQESIDGDAGGLIAAKGGSTPPPEATPQPEGALASAGRQIASKLFPAAATAVGGLAGGAAAGVAGLETGPGAIATAIVGDIAGGAAGGALGEKAQRSLMGEQWTKENQAQMDANMAAHPIASKIGAFIPAVISMLGGGGGATLEKAAGGYLERIAQSGATPTFIQKALASLPENMTIGARMGSAAAAENLSDGKGNYTDLLTEGIKGAVTMGPVAFVPAASTLLGAALGKAPADAAVLATSNALYDRATKGTPIDFNELTKDVGTDIPGFVLMNLLSGLTHGHPIFKPSAPEGGAPPTEPTSPTSPPSEPAAPSTPTTVIPQATPDKVAEPSSTDSAITESKTTPAKNPEPVESPHETAAPTPEVSPVEPEQAAPPAAPAGAQDRGEVPAGMTNLGDALDRAKAEQPEAPRIPGMEEPIGTANTGAVTDKNVNDLLMLAGGDHEKAAQLAESYKQPAVATELRRRATLPSAVEPTPSGQEQPPIAGEERTSAEGVAAPALTEAPTVPGLETPKAAKEEAPRVPGLEDKVEAPAKPETKTSTGKPLPAKPPKEAPPSAPVEDAKQRVQLRTGPQTYTVEEKLPTAKGDQPGEQFYRVRNERTGAEQTVEKADLKPIKKPAPKLPESGPEEKKALAISEAGGNHAKYAKDSAQSLPGRSELDRESDFSKSRGKFLESAQAFVGRNARAIAEKQGTTIEDGERQALLEWATRNRKVIPQNVFADRAPDDGGVEHDIFYGERGQRLNKVTQDKPLHDVPYYLERMKLQNDLFGDGIELEGITFHKSGRPAFVISQPERMGSHPTSEEIDAHMGSLGFKKVHPDSIGAWTGNGVHVTDGGPKNWIKLKEGGGIVPIDLHIERTASSIAPSFPEQFSTHEDITKAVNEWKQGVKTIGVEVLHNESELPPEIRGKLSGQDSEGRFTPIENHEGIYDNREKKVWLFSDNIGSLKRAEEVFAHEVIGHGGIEQTVDQRDWNGITNSIFTDPKAALEVRRIVQAYHGGIDPLKLNDGQRANVAREYIARLAEKPALNPGLWKSILLAVKKALRRLGIRRNWSLDELHDLVKQAATAVREEPHHSTRQQRDNDGKFNGPPHDIRASLWTDVRKKAEDEYLAGRHEWNALGTKNDIAGKFDAATNIARVTGEQIGNRIRLAVPDKADRAAMPFVIEAGGDAQKLQDFKAKIQASIDPENAKKYTPIIDHAIANSTRLEPARLIHEKAMADSLAELKAHGIDVGEVENYVTRKLEAPESVTDMLPNPLFAMGSGGGTPRYFTKERAFETLADAIEKGYKPKSTDVADLDQHRIEAGQRLIEQRKFLNEVKRTPAPQDGKPIIGDLEPRDTPAYRQRVLDWQANGSKGPPPKPELATPRGYSIVSVGGQPLPVHNQFAGLFRDLYGRSAIRDITAGRALLKAAAVAKSGTLVLDTFHIGRVLFKMATGGGGLPLTMRDGRPAFNIHSGRAALEYADSDLATAVAQGEITQKEADFARTNRPKVERLMRHGLNVGGVSDNLMEQAKVHIPILSDFNSFIFQKLSRSAMLQTALTGLERNLKRPEYAKDEAGAYRQTAKEMNELFGNLQNQGVFKSKTLQDVARLIFLAPQWTESQFRYEGRAYGQMAKGVGNAARLRNPDFGNAARAFAGGFVALLAANQVINYLSRGHSTFQNEEDRHQLDAWIPGGKRGFWFNPMEIAGEYAHAAFKYAAQHDNPVDIATHIASNKLSPLARGAKEALTGRDYSGRPFLSNTDRSRSAITSALPMPLPLGALAEKDPRSPLGYRMNRQPASVEKQLLQSVGAKVTAKQSPRSEIYALAKPFRADKGNTDSAGEYTQMRQALDNDEPAAVRSEIAWLQQRGKTLDQIRHAVGIEKDGSIHPEVFTGGFDREKELVASLTPKQRATYNQAQRDHTANAMKLKSILPSIAAKPIPRSLAGLPH